MTEITKDIHAQGFVNGKAGQCRVWLLEKTAHMKPVRKVVRPKKTYDPSEARSLDVAPKAGASTGWEVGHVLEGEVVGCLMKLGD